MVKISAVVGLLAVAVSAVHAHPELSARQGLPDPSGQKNVGNGKGTQFIGGQCLGKADCASGCCATFPKNGQTIGVCSGPGASTQAGKQGCGFEGGSSSGGAPAQTAAAAGSASTGSASTGGGSAAGGTVKPSSFTPGGDPSGAAHVGNGQGAQFIGGGCKSDADCASTCCALVNTGSGPFGICSGLGANTQNGKQGCGFPAGGQRLSATN